MGGVVWTGKFTVIEPFKILGLDGAELNLHLEVPSRSVMLAHLDAEQQRINDILLKATTPTAQEEEKKKKAEKKNRDELLAFVTPFVVGWDLVDSKEKPLDLDKHRFEVLDKTPGLVKDVFQRLKQLAFDGVNAEKKSSANSLSESSPSEPVAG